MTYTSFITRSLIVRNLAETAALAAALARAAERGDVLALHGDLGAGKSALARAFIRMLTSPDEDVPSPTYTLVQTYPQRDRSRPPIWHFDLYRLEDPEDALALNIEEAFADGISLVEWPGRLGSLLPEWRLDVTIEITPDLTADQRRITLTTADPRWADRLETCVPELPR